MNATEFARVKEALNEARSISPAQRAAWLEALREQDPSVHAEVVSLLAHEHASLPDVDAWIQGETWSGPRAESSDPGLVLPRVVEDGPDRAYTLVHVLGQGGFGDVFLARMHHREIERLVAIKLLKVGLASTDEAVARLRDEARLLGSLRHPGIVTFLGLLQIDGRPGIVTEYVQGDDLASCISGERAMPERAVVEVVERVADALATAFEEVGVVHRDVKPHNIRVGKHGDVKLLDFGIARSDALTRSVHTGSQQLIGTLRYLAPERLQAGAPAGHASDVFSLGSVLFESMAHEPLFVDIDLLAMCQLVARPEAFQSHIAARLEKVDAPAVRTLLESMLALDPEARPSAAAVAEQCDELAHAMRPSGSLRRWCRKRSWPAPPLANTPRPRRRADRTRVRAGLGVLAVAIAGVGLLAGPWWTTSPSTPVPEPVVEDAEPPEPVAALPEPQGPAFVPEPLDIPTGPDPAPSPQPASPPTVIIAAAPEGGERIPEPATEPAPDEAEEPTTATRAVEFASVPPGAEVVDPDTLRPLGTTPWSTMLPVGNHRFLLRRDGEERHVEVRVSWLGAGSRYTWHIADQRVSTTTVQR